jgi:hypothetical protein
MIVLIALSILNALCAALNIHQERFVLAWVNAYVSIFGLFAATAEAIVATVAG